LFLIAVAFVAWAGVVPSARAIFWNNDPAHGVTSTTGLTNRVDWFQNTHAINNTSNSTFGTTTLLNSEWAITVRHMVQNGSNYGQVTAPGNIYVNVSGVRYYADQIFTPDGGSEMALVHLRGGVGSALDATGIINSSYDEPGRVLHIGGYGYAGYFDAGGTISLGSFHRAYNIGYIAGNGQIRIIADGESALAANGLLEGTVGKGDSGGPMFAFYGRGYDISEATMDQWKLVGLTATGTGGSGGEYWGGSSNYTRVANYAGWINSTLVSLPAPGPASTGPWMQDWGNGLYDSGGDKMSVTGSNAAPAVHATFGPDGNGFTMDTVGDRISMTAVLDTTLSTGSGALRYGMLDDEGGTIPGDVSGGTPWNGYLAANAVEGAGGGVLEKGPNGGGVGQWWSFDSPNSAVLLARAVQATGTYDDAPGDQLMPPGRYALSLDYTRTETGLQIDFSTVQVDASNVPTGVYSHIGSFFDTTPASSSWTYDQLGFQLFGSSFTGSIIVDNVDVSFLDAAPLPGDYSGDDVVDAADYTIWRDMLGQTGSGLAADGNNDTVVDDLDYNIWKSNFGTILGGGSGLSSLAPLVPEPTAWLLAAVAGACLIASQKRCGRTREDA
jgi:hypothetical protein